MKAFSLVLRRWLPVVLWVGIVMYASTSAGSVEASAKIVKPFFLWIFPWLSEADARMMNMMVRKTCHAIQFLVFSLLVWRAVRLPPALRVSRAALGVGILGAALLLGSLSEGIQLMFKERGASLGDVGLDVLGAALGVLILWVVEGSWKKRVS